MKKILERLKSNFLFFIILDRRNFSESWKLTLGRVFGVFCVRFYQLVFSSFVGIHCRHFPSCSEYTYEAIARHGFWRGVVMGSCRIIRCGPWGTSGFDPVPHSFSIVNLKSFFLSEQKARDEGNDELFRKTELLSLRSSSTSIQDHL